MAAVARGHGGDAGGDPPRGPWMPLSNCQSKKFRPVGENASNFSSLVGVIVGYEIPKYYKSWKDVPDENKAGILPQIETYFDMRPHFSGRYGDMIRLGLDHMCAERYSDRKCTFKNKWFVEREGFMEIEEWNKNVDFILNESNVERSNANKVNRRKQKYPSLHGSRSYAAIRHDLQDPVTGEFPSLVSLFGNMHRRNNEYVNPIAQSQHQEMEQLRESQASSSNPLTEEQILRQVLGKRRGHSRGVGRQLPGVASSSNSRSKKEKVYTKEQVKELFAAKTAANNAAINAQLSSVFDALKRANIQIPDFQPINVPLDFVEEDDDTSDEGLHLDDEE